MVAAVKTFKKGGIHPDDKKFTAKKHFVKAPLPKMAIIHVTQHLGAPAKVIVKKGDKVKTGQLIAEASGFISANIHSSVTGKVMKIDSAIDASGYKKTAIFIKTDKEEIWEDGIDTTDDLIKDIPDNPQEIVEKVKKAGVVGMGGATFPTNVKLSPPPGKKAEYVIINGVECEPYLTVDHRTMLEYGHELMIGTKILMKALGVEKGIIGIESNKPDAIEYLTKLSKEYKNISVQPLKMKYPQGGEKQLIQAILGREVPSGGLPIDVGVVVQNVGTTVAVYKAVQKNMPLIERTVTVTGDQFEKSGNFIVRIGTPIKELVEFVGGVPENTGKIIAGGPMTGKALSSLEAPVQKGTSGIIFFPEEKSHRKQFSDCIRCAKCVSVCPVGLEPYLLMSLTQFQIYDSLRSNNVLDCIECGSCSYICPAYRPLLDYIRLGKKIITDQIRAERAKKQQ